MNHARCDRHLVVGGLVLVVLRTHRVIVHQLRNLPSLQRKDPRLRVLRDQDFLLHITSPLIINMIPCQVHACSIHVLSQWRLQCMLLHLPSALVHDHEGLSEEKHPRVLLGNAHHGAEMLARQTAHWRGKG